MEPIIWIIFVFVLISVGSITYDLNFLSSIDIFPFSVNPMKFSVCGSLVCLSMTQWNVNIIFKIDQNFYVVIFCFTYESTEQHSPLGKKL